MTVCELHVEINTGSSKVSTVDVCSTAGESEGTTTDSDCCVTSVLVRDQ